MEKNDKIFTIDVEEEYDPLHLLTSIEIIDSNEGELIGETLDYIKWDRIQPHFGGHQITTTDIIELITLGMKLHKKGYNRVISTVVEEHQVLK